MLTLFYQNFIKTSKQKTVGNEEHFKNILSKINTNAKDLSTKCRICLNIAVTSIYDVGNPEDMLEALQIFGIFIKEEENYPKGLCSYCLKFVGEAHLVRKICKQTEDILNKLVKQEVETNNFDDYNDNCDYSDSSITDTTKKEATPKWTNENFIDIKKEKKVKLKLSSKVTCQVCNKVINRSYYKEHLTMHDPDHKKYVCDVCGKSFRLRCAYHNHSLRHRTDFPYKCQLCPYRGRYAELLKTHMRTHSGDYRYMCTECPARFLFKSNLNSHMMKHKEPQYKCDSCKRAFHTKLMMQRHFEADHLGIKNHVCNICGKAFGYRNAMMKHQRHVHKREKLLFGRMPAYLQAENARQ